MIHRLIPPSLVWFVCFSFVVVPITAAYGVSCGPAPTETCCCQEPAAGDGCPMDCEVKKIPEGDFQKAVSVLPPASPLGFAFVFQQADSFLERFTFSVSPIFRVASRVSSTDIYLLNKILRI